jgi:hypothetical protein
MLPLPHRAAAGHGHRAGCNRIQPIAVRDVLHYLVGCASLPPEVNRAFDIGGPDVLTFLDMMQRYAAVAGLRRRVILPVRLLTPSLSSHWVGLVTPVPNAIARPLVESLVHEAVAHEHDIARYVPDPPGGLTGFDRAVGLALVKVRDAEVETRAGRPRAGRTRRPTAAQRPEVVRRKRSRRRPGTRGHRPPDALWSVVTGIGGRRGWYSFPLAWSVRGWLDRLVGGVGLRRGRRDPDHLAVGEALDFWRVEEIVPGELLRLRAEMRLPGRAWLEMRAVPADGGRSRYQQRAVFLRAAWPGTRTGAR